MRFILGGKDANRYPAFNGQLTGTVYSFKPGVFIPDVAKLKEFLAKQKAPIGIKVPLQSVKLVDAVNQRNPGTQSVTKEVEANFPKEYAFSGWFKWDPIKD